MLLGSGGAEQADDVEATIRRQLVGSSSGFMRTRLAAMAARRHARDVRNGYEQIGGTCPQPLRTREQAYQLQERLNARFGKALGVTFRTYVGTLSAPDGLQQTTFRVRQAREDRVVLVPTHPQYSRSATGVVLQNWHELDGQESHTAQLQGTLVRDYATHPKFLQAISERVDEALQRFPKHARRSVPFVFSAPTRPLRDLIPYGDPYNEQVQATARGVMAYRRTRDAKRPFYVSFQHGLGLGKMLSPRLDDTLEQLVDDGHATALVIPVAQVSDCVETAYGLDIAMREKADAVGFEQFEVASSLNSHPLFIETLADCVAGQLTVEDQPVDAPQIHTTVPEAAGIEMLVASKQASDAVRPKAA